MIRDRRHPLVATIACLLIGTAAHVASAQPPQDEDKPVLMMYALQYADAQECINVISSAIAAGRDVRLAVDPRSNSVLVQAPMGVHEEVRTIIDVLDRAVERGPERSAAEAHRNVEIELYWLSDSAQASSNDQLPDVISELLEGSLGEKMDADNATLVSQVHLSCISHSGAPTEFSAYNVGSELDNNYMLTTNGSIKSSADGRYQLNVGLEVNVGATSSQLDTSIVTASGHPVGVALAQTGTLNSVFILIVRDHE